VPFNTFGALTPRGQAHTFNTAAEQSLIIWPGATPGHFIPVASIFETRADDGRIVQVAAAGVPVEIEHALRILPAGTLDVYGWEYPADLREPNPGPTTLAVFSPPANDTGFPGVSTEAEEVVNTPQVITYPAAATGSGLCHAIHQMDLHYTSTPVGGNIEIKDGTTVLFSQAITATNHTILFAQPVVGTAETVMTVTLHAGGSGRTGSMQVRETEVTPW
jgi:hypothetical protein